MFSPPPRLSPKISPSPFGSGGPPAIPVVWSASAPRSGPGQLRWHMIVFRVSLSGPGGRGGGDHTLGTLLFRVLVAQHPGFCFDQDLICCLEHPITLGSKRATNGLFCMTLCSPSRQGGQGSSLHIVAQSRVPPPATSALQRINQRGNETKGTQIICTVWNARLGSDNAHSSAVSFAFSQMSWGVAARTWLFFIGHGVVDRAAQDGHDRIVPRG